METRTLFFLLITFLTGWMGLSADPVTLKRVEPSSWWIGMKNPNLQILVYGDQIGTTNVTMNIPGVLFKGVTKVENNNYLFLNLEITSNAKPGNYEIEFTKDNKLVVKTTFQLFERREGSDLRKGFDASDVIYLIMSDRFSNGVLSNDSTSDTYEKPDRKNPNGRHGGDIQGIINHLDYLKDLGVTAVWNTPMMEDNMQVGSYHTYAITDYYRIDPRYGSNDDYKRLSAELHSRNMKLIMDVVPNHCGLNYYWMKDLPTKDWVHQWDKFTRSNYHTSTIYDPYASDYDRKQDLDGWFDTSMPDLNQDNPLVLTYLIQNTVWWIEFANLDGLRVDTYPYNSTLKIAEWSKAIRTEYPDINIMGECWVNTTQEVGYWQTGSNNRDGYDSQLPTVMDFPLREIFEHAFNEQVGWSQGITRFYNHFTLDFAIPNTNHLLIFTENHDTPRFNELIDCDINKFKMAYTILFTIRGIPEIYYGSEIMMRGDKSKGDGDIRRDFPGGWPGDTRNAFNANERTTLENDAFSFMRKLIHFRESNPVISWGKTMQFIPKDNYYVYFRYNNEKTIMVILNNNLFGSTKIDTNRFSEIMSGFTSGYDVISEKKLTDLSMIEIPAKTSMIIELSK